MSQMGEPIVMVAARSLSVSQYVLITTSQNATNGHVAHVHYALCVTFHYQASFTIYTENCTATNDPTRHNPGCSSTLG